MEFLKPTFIEIEGQINKGTFANPILDNTRTTKHLICVQDIRDVEEWPGSHTSINLRNEGSASKTIHTKLTVKELHAQIKEATELQWH